MGTGIFRNKNRQSSIRTRMSMVIMVLTTVILFLFAMFNYFTTKARMMEDLDYLSEITVDRMARNLISAVWDVDKTSAEETVKAEMMEKRIYAIVITESDGKTVFIGKKRDHQWTVTDLENETDHEIIRTEKYVHTAKSRDIIKENDRLGTIEICFTSKFMQEELNHSVRNIVITVLVLNIALAITLFISIKKISDSANSPRCDRSDQRSGSGGVQSPGNGRCQSLALYERGRPGRVTGRVIRVTGRDDGHEQADVGTDLGR